MPLFHAILKDILSDSTDISECPESPHSLGTSDGDRLPEDLSPTPFSERSWTALDFAIVWASLSISVPTYMIGGGLLSSGLNWWQATITIFLGNIITLFPLLLNAHAGTKYGIPFPVFLRSSFGIYGASVMALTRGLVGVGWFSLQCWVGGSAIFQAFCAIFPQWRGNDKPGSPSILHLLFFLAFVAMHAVFIRRDIFAIKSFEKFSVPVLGCAGLVLFIYCCGRVGLSDMLDASYSITKDKKDFWVSFWPALTSVIAGWSTLALNVLDFTRFAKNQREQMVGQTVGLPTTMTAFAFLGIAVTSASVVMYGEALWNPSDLFAR